MKKKIFPAIIFAFLMLVAVMLRKTFPGDPAVWPGIYLLLGVAALLPGIFFPKRTAILISSQILFSILIALAAADGYFLLSDAIAAARTKDRGKDKTGPRIWCDYSPGKIEHNGKMLEVFDPRTDIFPAVRDDGRGIFRPGLHKLHRSAVPLADGGKIFPFVAEYTIDEFGFRKVPLRRSDNPDAPILLFGDSFTFGEGVDDDRIFSTLLAKHEENRRNVYNFASSGWSPAEFLYLLQNHALDRQGLNNPRLKHGFFLLIGDHLERPARFQLGIDFDRKNDKIAFRPRKSTLRYYLQDRVFYKSRSIEKLFYAHARRSLGKVYLSMLRNAQKILQEQYHCKLAVIVYPDCTSEMLADLRAQSFPLIELAEHMPGYRGYHTRKVDPQYEIEYDGHPNIKTHQIISAAIIDFLQKTERHPQSDDART
ncbi:MAG: hypothetical protein PHS41_08505 [Victivallaceae bacterium]|nr:hypothetical protein [Victivallaceae bacterium]